MSSLFARARKRHAANRARVVRPPIPAAPGPAALGAEPTEAKTAVPKQTAKLRRMAEIFRRKGRANSAEMLLWAAAVCENEPSESTVLGVVRGLIWAATRDQKP